MKLKGVPFIVAQNYCFFVLFVLDLSRRPEKYLGLRCVKFSGKPSGSFLGTKVVPREVSGRPPERRHLSYQDTTLKCVDCGNEFVFTAGEQEFYAKKGFGNTPKRCYKCRKAKKTEYRANRAKFDIICANCGKTDQVPFEPRGDRPVFCSDCFRSQRAI